MVAGGGSAGFGPQRLARRGGDDGHYVVREDAGCAIQQASSAGRGDELLPVLRLARYGGDEALKLVLSLTSAGRRLLPAHFFWEVLRWHGPRAEFLSARLAGAGRR